jgi:tetratricopeptide (TPR) repeat protein
VVGLVAVFLTRREPTAPPSEQSVPVVAVSPPVETPSPEPSPPPPPPQQVQVKEIPSARDLLAPPTRSLADSYEAWRKDRSDLRAHADLARHLQDLDLAAAEPWYRKILAQRPVDPDFASAFSDRLNEAKRYQDTIETFKPVLQRDPDGKNGAAEALRDTYLALEDDKTAAVYARKALAVDPTPENFSVAADIENNAENYVAAVSTAKRGQAEIARRRTELAARPGDWLYEDLRLTDNELWMARAEIDAELSQGHKGDARRLVDALKSRIMALRSAVDAKRDERELDYKQQMTKLLDKVEASVFKLEDRL